MAKRSNRDRMRAAAARYKASSGEQEALDHTVGTETSSEPQPEPRRSRRRGGASRAPSGPVVVVQHQSNPGVAAVLSFLLPGLGLLYAGQVAIGLAVALLYPSFVVGTYFLFAVAGAGAAGPEGAIGGVVIWAGLALAAFIGQVVWAYSAATKANRSAGRRRR